jgi:hypothetical protein
MGELTLPTELRRLFVMVMGILFLFIKKSGSTSCEYLIRLMHDDCFSRVTQVRKIEEIWQA